MSRRSRERWGVALAGGLFLLGFWLSFRAFGAAALVPALAVVFALLALLVLDSSRRIRKDLEAQAQQVQHLVGLYATLEPGGPLPPLGGYSMEPDCASVLAQHILRHEPRLIVEAGSGSSTIVAAYCLRRIGAGKVIALEQGRAWAEAQQLDLERRGLSAFAEVRVAPLERQSVDGREFDWFAAAARRFDAPIDLLVVDGPPAAGNREARFPALPLLAGQLAPEAWILCDDADRRGERRILERWNELYPRLEREILPTKRGTAVLRLVRG
jgi:hypothetical protein